jgi:competence protein ComEC
MSLPMAVYFHRVTALGLPVNLVVVPLIGLALPSALITFATLLIWPAIAIVPGAVTAALLHAITSIVQHFSLMSAGDIRVANPGTPVILLGILLIGAAVWCARNSRWPVLLPIAALACSAACVFYPRAMVFRPGVMEVTAIDVGQGDSLLLVSPTGKTMLVDAGGPTGGSQAAHGNFEVGEDVVSPVLWSRSIRRLDALVLSHAHSDHMGGMPAVMENFRPRMLVVGQNPDIPAYRALLAEARRLNIPVVAHTAGEHFEFGGTQVDVLAPPVGYEPGSSASNDDSLVLHVRYGRTSVLFEGDAQTVSEGHMLGENLRSDLLKVGHHGSKTSTTPQFLAAVSPSYAVISVAHRNPYGHPKWDTLQRLQNDRVRTFRTDAEGATSFYLDGNSVSAKVLPIQ